MPVKCPVFSIACLAGVFFLVCFFFSGSQPKRFSSVKAEARTKMKTMAPLTLPPPPAPPPPPLFSAAVTLTLPITKGKTYQKTANYAKMLRRLSLVEGDIGGYPIPQYPKKKWQIPKYRDENRLNTDTVQFSANFHWKVNYIRPAFWYFDPTAN